MLSQQFHKSGAVKGTVHNVLLVFPKKTLQRKAGQFLIVGNNKIPHVCVGLGGQRYYNYFFYNYELH